MSDVFGMIGAGDEGSMSSVDLPDVEMPENNENVITKRTVAKPAKVRFDEMSMSATKGRSLFEVPAHEASSVNTFSLCVCAS